MQTTTLAVLSVIAATLLRQSLHSAAAAGAIGRKLLGDEDHRAWLQQRLARSVNMIIDEYLGTRSVVMFADEVRRSDLGQRLLANMAHPRLLVSSADLRLANGLIVYLEGGLADDHDVVLGRLPSSDHSRHLVLWAAAGAGSGVGDRVDLHRIQVMFETFWQYQLIDVAALVPMSTGSIRVYTFNPYTGSRCNKAGPPVMTNIWSGWMNAFVKPDRVFGMDNKLKDLHKYTQHEYLNYKLL